VVTLQGNQKVFRSRGPAGFPPMDQLYVPKVQSPVHYSDYNRTSPVTHHSLSVPSPRSGSRWVTLGN
jgi:hypothetical protein